MNNIPTPQDCLDVLDDFSEEYEMDSQTKAKVKAELEESKRIQERLEYLRGEIEAERISYAEIFELQSLASYIDPGDTLLLEWAGVPENI